MAELLKLEISGLTEWAGQTQAMQERLDDMTPVFEAGDEWFRAEMGRQFETQGAYLQNGEMWAPLSPEYAKRKPDPPSPFGILYLTGDLYRSLSNADDPQHVMQVGKHEGTYGSTVPYGKYHQTGTSKMPQRKIIIARGALYELFMRAIEGWVIRGRDPRTRK